MVDPQLDPMQHETLKIEIKANILMIHSQEFGATNSYIRLS